MSSLVAADTLELLAKALLPDIQAPGTPFISVTLTPWDATTA